MNRNQNCGPHVHMPGVVPPRPGCPPTAPQQCPPPRPAGAPGMPQQCPPPRPNPTCPQNIQFGVGRYPVGMGYVPVQSWENIYPMDQGFQRGTIFQALDYPFLMGRCRR